MIEVLPGGAIEVRVPSLVVLVGPSGAGKSAFARRIFGQHEVVSSDACRAMIADTEDEQSVTPEAFELLRFIARLRLQCGRVAVVDATNVRSEARARNLELARNANVESVAVALDVPLAECLRRNAARRRRTIPDEAVRSQRAEMDAALETLDGEGFDRVYRLSVEAMDSARLVRVGLRA